MAEAKKPKPQQEIPALFKDSFFKSETGSKKKALAFPIAVFVHAALVISDHRHPPALDGYPADRRGL